MSKIIYGSEVAASIKEELKQEISLIKGRLPKLCVVLVGNNPASLSYVKGKEKATIEVGMLSDVIRLDEQTSEQELIKLINQLNNDDSVDGILVQMPLPKHISENNIMEHISPKKDVDGLNPYNIGRLYLKEEGLFPCTPLGVIEILKRSNIKIAGKNAVIVGRSKLVGNPVSKM